MAYPTVLERSHVLPLLPATGGPTSLPLTFLDLPWLFFHPSRRIFFYDYPHPASHFTAAALPHLKSSLSLALSLFYPLAGHLHAAPPRRPTISSSPTTAGVSLTVAESDDDFHDVSHNDDARWSAQRAARRFRHLVPALASCRGQQQEQATPVMAIQITLFPASGFSVGIAYQHVAADERTFNNFLKAWAAFCSAISGLRGQYPADSTPMINPPVFDRSIIREVPALEQRFLHDWWKHSYRPVQSDTLDSTAVRSDTLDSTAVRSTFVVGPAQMELVRSWITRHCEANNGLALPVHLSPYVLACALLWVVRLRTHFHLPPTTAGKDESESNRAAAAAAVEGPSYFGFIAGGITRIDYPVPAAYFGNCVGFGRAEAAARELLGEAGILHAARAIGGAIKRLDRSVLEGAEEWVAEWREMAESDGLHIVVVGSPKVDFYGTNFGWGRPRKVEEVSIDWTGAVSLHQSRDVAGAMEVGLSLPTAKMDTFRRLFKDCLVQILK
ncbi:hypothetical protein SAY86_007853 [Trapa natans]|uniref:Anthocyanin 5-aromatic acyltransferase n=1 Tax=Trapa natans TaxID=22666 RepID=A0AAN7LFU9_TRANT|nr:hypothetical protein SAY86_007853 [Trapa natans]